MARVRSHMKKLLLRGFGLVAAFAGVASAADLPAAPPPLPVWTWTGGYVGGHLGAMWGSSKFTDPLGPSIFGDTVSTPGFLGGFQAGYNWQAPQTRFVLGIEADLSGLVSDGTNTCLASSGFFLSANCRVTPNVSTTVTPRIGYAVDPARHTLLYIKGGFATVHDHVDLTSNAVIGLGTDVTANIWKTGWTAGAGVERALTPAWSLRLEYDYLGFGHSNVPTPLSVTQTIPGDPFGYALVPQGTTSISQNVQQVKLGLNYHFGIDPWSHWVDMPSALSAGAAWAPAVPTVSWLAGWELEAGGRYWYSSGKFQKNLGGTTSGTTANILVSRLTYDSVANSGEIFTRVESPDNIFLKGFLGTGALASGHMNDEDWLVFDDTVPYSNTLSNPVKGTISYATGDAGYDVFRTATYRLGGFVGYNYYRDKKDAYGCTQIANAFSDCVPAVPSTVLGITENDTWNSLRVGVNGDLTLLPGLRLNTDAAFLPFTQFSGVDTHWQRTDAPNQNSTETGHGIGVQLDAILSYAITPAFNVGAGGRYWAMWTNNNAYTNIFGTPCPCQTLPVKTDRFGLLVQASYKFGVPGGLAAR
ncbi:MAG TPA: outer membrane beta-barrel protein [Xanthobacteraceae bacterium]|jgi:opacity protein-like surface antigen|nr:outer membrane beta-barrel protein [Xanthobacteraceae bacterium]